MHRSDGPAVRSLDPFIGQWNMQAAFPAAPPSNVHGLTVFDWEAGRALLVQRWEVPHPDAPDGIAIIRFDDGRGTFLQHYFDSRGVARVYEMGFSGGVWTLSRTTPDLSPLEFSQRFTGTFGADGTTIEGQWDISRDGSHWEHDFDIVYTKLSTAQAS